METAKKAKEIQDTSSALTQAERAELESYRRQRAQFLEDYHEFGKAPVGSPERIAAHISYLSPYNLRSGAEVLRQWRDEAVKNAKDEAWMSTHQNAPCCADKHQTFYGAVTTSPQWKAWGKYQHRMWDVDESMGLGILSNRHFQAFMEFCVKISNDKEKK